LEGWVFDGYRVTHRSTPWARAFSAIARTKSINRASVCRQLSLNKTVALHSINKKKLQDTHLMPFRVRTHKWLFWLEKIVVEA